MVHNHKRHPGSILLCNHHASYVPSRLSSRHSPVDLLSEHPQLHRHQLVSIVLLDICLLDLPANV